MARKKIRGQFICARCGSRKPGWARGLQSGRWVCANCYAELPFDSSNPDPDQRGYVIDDMRTDVPTKRKIIVRF